MVTRSKFHRPFTQFTVVALAIVGVLASASGVDAQGVVVLHSFPPANPVNPKAPLIRASDGQFYGTTEAGGAFNLGTVFKMAPDGTVTVLHAFESSSDGASPVAALVQGADGNFYGTTPTGGASGAGTAFKMTPGGVVTILHAFTSGSDGATPTGSLIQATDGNFYGTTRGGGSGNRGTAFRMSPTGTVTILHAFTGGADGSEPASSLIQATDGNLYGTTVSGGSGGGSGVVFKMTTGGVFTVMHTFVGDDGANSNAGLIQASDGSLYGTTAFGGAFFHGSVFRMTLAGAFTRLYSFAAGADGLKPLGALVQGIDGNFYGTTQNGGAADMGTVFRLTPAGVPTILHAFNAGADGFFPTTALVSAPDGTLYGTVSLGGAPGAGGVFTIATGGGGFSMLHTFVGNLEGVVPQASLIQATDGNLYGTTAGGGQSGAGTVFKTTPAGVTTVLHSFNYINGSGPFGALLQGTDGKFYGTTRGGGAFGRGTVFSMTAAGALTVLHAFNDADGGAPVSALIQATDGNFYGTTRAGGSANSGTAFKITAAGAFTLLHSFTGPDGSNLYSGLVQAADGFLYGTASTGGASGLGTAFKMGTDGTTTVLHHFAGGLDGAMPRAPLIQGIDGNFYGTTQAGGSSGRGTAFRMTSGGAVDVLHAFTTTEGSFPTAALVESGGYFYGTTPVGTGFNRGSLFKVAVNGSYFTLHTFTGADGSYPNGALIRTADRSFYGTTSGGGATESGTVIKFREGSSGDFDGDGKTDIAVFRPSTGVWYLVNSSTGSWLSYAWGGGAGDIPVPGDYDGDGKTDIAVFRPSTGVWYIVNSSGSWLSYAWGGGAGDIPVPGDYDGDGKTDIAVFRPSTGVWYIVNSSGSWLSYAWGGAGDIPVPGDYDGDGKTDLAVFRPSTGVWYIVNSSGSWLSYAWGGGAGDIPVPGDYDGDGKTDIAVFRPSTGVWYIVNSSGSWLSYAWGGGAGDIPVPGDYDGDGKTDLAVFRPSTGVWYIVNSSTGSWSMVTWGGAGDIPVLKH